MKSAIVFTSTLSPKIMNWLKTHSQEKNLTKREILERAILLYKENQIKHEMAASFKKASQDREIIEMAEEGMEDYQDQLKDHHL